MFNGFVSQILWATFVTIKLALSALVLGLIVGLIGAWCESIQHKGLRYFASGFILILRGLPELLVLFVIYFGLTALLTTLSHHYVEISAFYAGTMALGLIFGAYASQVFHGAFLAIDHGQIEAAHALGFSKMTLFLRIQLPQAWRHALPGLGNLWLVLVKDTTIVTLIGLSDMMNKANLAASTTHQPFYYYLFVACLYLLITTCSERILHYFVKRTTRYVTP